MTIHAQYNVPLDQVTVSFGTFNVEDQQKRFKVGIIDRPTPNRIRWHEEPQEWKTPEEIRDLSFVLSHDDIVVVERKIIDNEEIESRVRINIGDDWPADAHGGTSVDRPYIF